MKTKKILYISLLAFISGLVLLMMEMDAFAEKMLTVAVASVVIIFPIAAVIELFVRRHEFEEKRKVRLARIKEEQEARRLHQEEKQLEWKHKEIERQKPRMIVEVKYLGIGATTQKRGGVGGAVIGGLLGGTLGAAIGANIPQNADSLHQFAVKYADGHIEIKSLHPNSWEYKELMKQVKWEEL